MSEPRRWTLTGYSQPAAFVGEEIFTRLDGPDLAAGESVVVMPVSEHEEIVASLNQSEPGSAYFTSPAMKRLADEHDRLRKAAQDVVDAIDTAAVEPRDGSWEGRWKARGALERLRAAVNPQEDE